MMSLIKTLEICGAYFYDRISDKTGAYSGWKDTFGNSNKEIKNLFIKKIREWFRDTSANDGKRLEEFCNAF